MNNILRNLARALPDDVLFGETFRLAKKINTEFNNSTDKADFVASYQAQKLKYLIHIASQAPFYSYLEGKNSIHTLPFINKEIVLKSSEKMIVDRTAADCVTTGGTSGKPLSFIMNKNRKGFEWFWMTNNWSKVGYNTAEYRAVLRNHKLNGKLFKVDRLLKEYQYNNFALTEKYLDFVIKHISEQDIKFLHAYPSAAHILATRIKNTGSKSTLKTFLCGSENIFPFQKELIQNELKIRMYTWFGHSEKLILAGEDTVCQNYHSNPFYGLTEIIDENGNQVKTKGVTGELVGTGFINTKMPFIRYQTGDFAEYLGDVCPDCGHIGVTFRNVKGRWHGDKIYKSDGSVITTTALNLHNDSYNYIKNIQYVQHEKGKLEVRVIPETTYNQVIKQKLLNELLVKVGAHLKIEIVEVPKVEYSINNKFQLLIQKIDTAKELQQ